MSFTSFYSDLSIRIETRFFILIISLLAICQFSFAQSETFLFDSAQRVIYHEASQLRIVSAKQKLEIEKKNSPNNLANFFIEDFSEFLAVMVLSSKDAFELYKSKNNLRIEIFEKTSLNSPYIKFCLSEFYLHRSIACVFFNEKFRAVLNLKKARSYAQKNSLEYPEFQLNDKPKALLNILLGSIPPSFKWASGLISLNGDYNTGIVQLDRLLNRAYVKEELGCFFPEMLSYKVLLAQQSGLNSMDEKKIKTYFSTLTVKRELAKNYLLIYAWSGYLMRNGDNDIAIAIMEKRVKDSGYIPFWPIEFVSGVAYQNRLDDNCKAYFYSYIKGVRSGNYINASYQRLAWQSLIDNDGQGYFKFIQQIDNKNVSTEQDQAALFEKTSGQKPMIPLLKARLLFDGGYYNEAKNQLLSIKISSISNKLSLLEYYYRLARIYEKTSLHAQALILFNKVIIEGVNIENYYAANAALNAGNICELLHEKGKAILYYKKCLSLSPNQYKESIHQKAKIGLEQLK